MPSSSLDLTAFMRDYRTDYTRNLTQDNMRGLRAGHAKARAGVDMCEVWIGDSLTAGYNGTTFDRLNSIPRVYEKTVAQIYGLSIGSTGLVRFQDQAFTNTAVTLGGTWNTSISTYLFTTTATSTITWAPAQAGTSVDIWYARSGATGAFTVSVDGAVSGVGFASVAAGGAAGTVKVTLSGLANTAHSIVITATTATTVIIVGGEVYTPNNANAGLRIHNVAQSGSYAATGTTYASWTNLTDAASGLKGIYGPLAAYSTTPSAVHLLPSTNDITAGTPQDTIAAALTTIASWWPDRDLTSVILHCPPHPNQNGSLSLATWLTWRNRMRALSDSTGLPLIDAHAVLGGYALENKLGLTGDAIAHLNSSGYAVWGRATAVALAT